METEIKLFQDEYPSKATVREQLKYLVRSAILAPSGHNTQPWLFRIADTHLDLIADRTRALPVVDPHDRELIISCGAALDHFDTAGRYFGYEVLIQELPLPDDPDTLARMRLGEEQEPSDDVIANFSAMATRRTTRTRFDNRVLPDEMCDTCQALARDMGVELTLITDRVRRSEVADLVAEGDRIQFADPHFRRELASWVHSRRSATKDGMSGAGFGMPDALSSVGALVIRTFDLGKGVAASDREKIVDGSPLLAVFSTPEDKPVDWLATGRALSKVLLTLASSGATASYLNPPVELEGLRLRLKRTVGASGVPQLLMRFGYGPLIEATIRRTVEEVLT